LLDHSTQKVILNIKDTYGKTPLHYVSEYGHHVCVQTLLDYGTNDRFIDINTKSPHGRTPSSFCITGHNDCVKTLLAYRASLNEKTYRGLTPLHLASKKGYMTCVITLLDHGADVHEKSDNGLSTLDLALTTNIRAYIKKYIEGDMGVKEPAEY
jgi:ankyrin repeat protein